AEAMVAEVVDRVHEAANMPDCDCDADVAVERMFSGYRLPPSAPAVRAAEAALRACGHEPLRIASGGASDANALIAKGLQTVNLANGTERNHEPGERVSEAALEQVQAVDLGLGSGGFDVVHVNLTRGLAGAGQQGGNVMKLNYTSLQHAVLPIEDGQLELPVERPVAVLALHGQLAAVAWAFHRRAPSLKLGYVQTAGGALPGGHSHTVRALRRRGLLAGPLTAGASFGGDAEAIATAGALHHGLRALGWDAAVCGPGPG